MEIVLARDVGSSTMVIIGGGIYVNYSTGELAKLCNVTTRTIQYYDRKGILKPQGFTEGKRRIQNNSDKH